MPNQAQNPKDKEKWPNVGQDLLDVVEVTDARCGISAKAYRVQGIRTLYDRRKGHCDQTLTLGAP